MLDPCRHLEKRKDQKKDEEVVNGKRELDDISGKEFETCIGALIPEDNSGEDHCQRDPDSAPDCGFAILDCVSFTIEESEVQAQHEKYEQRETDP